MSKKAKDDSVEGVSEEYMSVHGFLAALADGAFHQELVDHQMLPQEALAPLAEVRKCLDRPESCYPHLVEKVLNLEAEKQILEQQVNQERLLRQQMQKERDEIHKKLKALRDGPPPPVEPTPEERAELATQWKEEHE